ncbi:uncharacterized protein LOC122374672 [Amphibalanus amphitrite]|uniref:uncharacterized protein LOC122374672 n=1 Tax=Amphibalanus amphitrite TaxID=1232801 RepID=UPI001C9106A3|nr:uncharacterized protein LOC122374672 [Amphibalanus amphitrite]
MNRGGGLGFLLVAVVVAAVVQIGTGSVVEDQFSRLLGGRCVPSDIVSLTSLDCHDHNDHTAELLCIASSYEISSDQGYDQAAGETYVDKLSKDKEWTTRQKGSLTRCYSMVLDQVPADKEGAFVLACWHQLLLSECNRKNMTTYVEVVDPENAKELVEAVADLAEGPCFNVGLKYADELGMKWEVCARDKKLDMSFLQGAAHYYMLFSQGQEIPDVTLENNRKTMEQLDRLNETSLCYAEATGEVQPNGEINYDLINEATRNAIGPERFKVVDRAFVDFCREGNPGSIAEYYACFNREKPFACAVLKSYDIALGRQTPNGASIITTTVAPATAGFIASLLGSIF